ncbi:MAG: ATP-binding protein [Winogradskyella sp.]|nr:MAG: ATP-binding protein [Winogradskyella sp.]
MIINNAVNILYNEINWLQQVINQVIKTYLLQDGHEENWLDIPLPDITELDNPYANKIIEWDLNVYERLALILAITPHLRPEVLDIFFGKNQLYDRGFTEFGGVLSNDHSGFLPTAQTLSFLITANDPHLRSELENILDAQNILFKLNILSLASTDSYIPNFNGVLSLNDNWFNYFLTGELKSEEHSDVFPAKRITTKMEWDDVVLDEAIMEQVMEINSWLSHGNTIMKEWELDKILKPGYRTLFYGPPGTGKTLTATLLGKASNREVYKVDLSMIVSKYIGETEKNLAKIFDIAEHKNWILFFDEADALFGKRTAANSSNDRYANQQTSYLLQRIEDFPGVVILASNLKANMDDAFTRRFQSMIHFKMPSVKERYQIWSKAFSGKCKLHPDIDLWKIAEDYEIAGGAIINVLRFCALQVIRRDDTITTQQEIIKGIRREFKKDNKTIKAIV